MNTRLLVSVRSLAEARIAARESVDLIDLKEPSRGSLGAVSAWVAAQVAAELGGRHALSLALGELLDAPDERLEPDLLRWFRFAKIGLAGCADRRDWDLRWWDWAARLPRDVRPVAVAYADWPLVHAPRPEDVLRLAARHGSAGLLLDTAEKQRGSLLQWLPLPQLRQLIEQAQDVGVWVAVAGSLDSATIPRVCALGPQWIAVRGAVCRAGRQSEISASRLRAVVAALRDGRQDKIVDTLGFTSDTRRSP